MSSTTQSRNGPRHSGHQTRKGMEIFKNNFANKQNQGFISNNKNQWVASLHTIKV